MAKKILIAFPHPLSETYGGAYSYLFQLKKAFGEKDVTLHFLHEILDIGDEPSGAIEKRPGWKIFLKKLLPSTVTNSIQLTRYLQKSLEEPWMAKLKTVNFSQYDAIHFHETIDLWRLRRWLRHYQGTIILTSHSPKPYHLELLEDVFGLTKEKISAVTYRRLERIDRVAFSAADILLSPAAESLQSYAERWPPFASLVAGIRQVFIPTGMAVPVPTTKGDVVRRQWKIPPDAFVVCFNGRHLPVKGYDLFVAAASRLLDSGSPIYFLVTGVADDPPLLRHAQWKETGWTSLPQNILQAANLVVVPNREAYFDLNVLQCLALGRPVLLSKRGGHLFFQLLQAPGILYLNELTPAAFEKAIAEAYANRVALAAQVPALRQTFQEHFSLNQFAAAYYRFYLSV